MISKFNDFNKDYWEIEETEYNNIKNNNWYIFSNLQVHLICDFIKSLKHVSNNIALSSIKDKEDYECSYIYNNKFKYKDVKAIKYFIYDRDAYDIIISNKNYYVKHFKRRKNKYVYYKCINDGIIPLIKNIIQKNIRNNF